MSVSAVGVKQITVGCQARQHLTTTHNFLPASPLTYFACQKLVVKVANGNQVTTGHGEYHKYTLAAKCPNHSQVTIGTL